MNLKLFFKAPALKDFSIILLILGITTLVFHITDLDISLQQFFYSHDKGWFMMNSPFWDFIYRVGIFPGYLFAILGLIMISASYWKRSFIKYRKAAVFLVFTLILGPGISVNLLLKDHWGRPRPREITQFDGKEKFVCVCVKGDSINGKSFPCGHCSMGFYMAIPYLFLRRNRKFLAYSFLTSGIIYGCIMGISRMMAGGHFASDVIWAGGIVWIIALAGFYLFKVDKPVRIPLIPDKEDKKKARTATILAGILIPVITIALLLATPYISKKSFTVNNYTLKQANCKTLIADLKDASVNISNDTCFESKYEVNGFGFPNSKLRAVWTIGDTSTYMVGYMGWFTEIRSNVGLKLPLYDSRLYLIRINEGKIYIHLPDSMIANLELEVKKGNIFINTNRNKNVTVIGSLSSIINNSKGKIRVFPIKPDSLNIGIIQVKVKEGTITID